MGALLGLNIELRKWIQESPIFSRYSLSNAALDFPLSRFPSEGLGITFRGGGGSVNVGKNDDFTGFW